MFWALFAAFLLFALALVFTAWLVSLRMIDRLVRLEYACYRERWEEDGKPTRLSFRPPETTMLGGLVTRPGSWLASLRCYYAWLFGTPEWMRQDQRALRWVFWFRVSTLVCYACILGTVAIIHYLALHYAPTGGLLKWDDCYGSMAEEEVPPP